MRGGEGPAARLRRFRSSSWSRATSSPRSLLLALVLASSRASPLFLATTTAVKVAHTAALPLLLRTLAPPPPATTRSSPSPARLAPAASPSHSFNHLGRSHPRPAPPAAAPKSLPSLRLHHVVPRSSFAVLVAEQVQLWREGSSQPQAACARPGVEPPRQAEEPATAPQPRQGPAPRPVAAQGDRHGRLGPLAQGDAAQRRAPRRRHRQQAPFAPLAQGL